MAVNLHLLSNQFFQKLYSEVLLLHLRNFFQKLRIKEREFLVHIGEEVNYAITLYAGFQKLVNPGIHFRQRYLLAFALIHQSGDKHTHGLKERSLHTHIFFYHRGAK